MALKGASRVSATFTLLTSTLLVFQLTLVDVFTRISIFCKLVTNPTTTGSIGVAIIAAHLFTPTVVDGAGVKGREVITVVCCNRYCELFLSDSLWLSVSPMHHIVFAPVS